MASTQPPMPPPGGPKGARPKVRDIPTSSVKNKIITPDELASSIGTIPSTRNVEIFPHGTIRNDIISVGDKPAGQEAGILFYVRDKNYYDALQAITPTLKLMPPDLKIPPKKPAQAKSVFKAIHGLYEEHNKTLDTVYEQFIAKYHREKSKGRHDVEGKLYQQLFKDYERMLNSYGNDLKATNAKFKEIFLYKSLVHAHESLEKINQKNPPDLTQLEQTFDKNPVLMGIYLDEIEKRNAKVPKKAVTTYMLKLDYQGKELAYKGRLAETNTAKKAGLKEYYSFLKSEIKKTKDLSIGEKKIILDELKTAFHQRQLVKTRHKALSKIITKRIPNSAEDLLARADERRKKAQVKSIQARHIGKGIQAYFLTSPLKISLDAIREKIATQHASQSGLHSQAVQTLRGESLEDPTLPKQLLASVWEKNFLTFEEMADGNAVMNGIRFPAIQLEGGKPPNPLSESSYLSLKVLKQDGSQASVSASHLFQFGPQLALFLVHLDRDAMGQAGQNKGVRVDKSGKIQLFGIDFGKSFKKRLNNVKLKDDFSFNQPGIGDRNNIVNMASFYDTPYVDRIEGVHRLAKQFGHKVPENVKKDFASVWEDSSIEKGSHSKPFDEEISHYNNLIETNEKEIEKKREMLSTAGTNKAFRKPLEDKIATLESANKNYRDIISEVNKMQKVMNENYETLLKVFDKRLNLSKDQLTLLDSLEKLVSKPTRHSVNGQVLLHHLRVEPKNRIPFQFELNTVEPLKGQPKLENGQYTLRIDETTDKKKTAEALASIKRYADTHGLELGFQENPPAIRFKKEQEKQLIKAFTEEGVATHLGLNTPEIQQTLALARDRTKIQIQANPVQASEPQNLQSRMESLEQGQKAPVSHSSSGLLFSKDNSSRASVRQALTQPEKKIIQDLVKQHNRYEYTNEADGGFSIKGPNPLTIIAQAQLQGLKPITYTLTCNNPEEALRILNQNEAVSRNNTKNKVEIDTLNIKGTIYSLEAFKETFGDKKPEPNLQKPQEGSRPNKSI